MHDVLIGGAGSAACVLAARRSEDPRTNFLLLEAGGARPGAQHAHPASSDVIHAG